VSLQGGEDLGNRTTEDEGSGIGLRLRAARQRVGWSREALAFHSGISWSAIAQVESGRRKNVRPRTLSALAGALGVTIDYLVRGAAATAMFEHRALLYGTDEELCGTAGPFIAEGIERSEATLVVTTGARLKLLREQVGDEAELVDFVEAKSWYSAPGPTLEAYRGFVDAKLEGGAAWVRIVGEPVWGGRSESDVRLWTRYEALLNLVFAASPLTILCPYDERSTAPEILHQARLTHPHTLGRDGIADSPEYAEPGGFVLGE
jgi:transcriptional regulator with XRE-family HTH domain